MTRDNVCFQRRFDKAVNGVVLMPYGVQFAFARPMTYIFALVRESYAVRLNSATASTGALRKDTRGLINRQAQWAKTPMG